MEKIEKIIRVLYKVAWYCAGWMVIVLMMDPLLKKPIYHHVPYATILFLSITLSLLATALYMVRKIIKLNN